MVTVLTVTTKFTLNTGLTHATRKAFAKVFILGKVVPVSRITLLSKKGDPAKWVANWDNVGIFRVNSSQ